MPHLILERSLPYFSAVIRIKFGNDLSLTLKLISLLERSQIISFLEKISFGICTFHFELQKVYLNRDGTEN